MSFRFPAVCQNLEKNNDPIPRKYLESEKDEQILFCRTRRATVAGAITLVDERLAEQKPLLLQNLYITNESSVFSPSIDSSSL